MKLIRCTVWLICAALVIATLDSIPDPPAVNPHSEHVKAPILRESFGADTEQRWNCAPARSSSPLHLHFIASAHDPSPTRPSDSIVLAGYAADPSPPAA